MRKRIGLSLIFLIGFLLLMYPVFSNMWNEYRQRQLASGYEESIANLSQTEYERMMEEAIAYNEAHHPYWVPDAFAEGQAEEESGDNEEYESILNIGDDGIMCYIEIPKINIKIPVYHGTSEEVLAKGAGHLAGSSLPVGGESTHAVIAAHRGLPSASLFTDLNLLEEGDLFYIYVLDETLAYEVEEILVVEPDETESLTVVEGEDLVTLVTCTPYGINTQRLLVRGHRVDYDEEVYEEEVSSTKKFSLVTSYKLVAAIGLLIVLLFTLAMRFYYNRKRRLADE